VVRARVRSSSLARNLFANNELERDTNR
jgi:hypothetical protein